MIRVHTALSAGLWRAGIILLAWIPCQSALAAPSADPPGVSLKNLDADERALFGEIAEEQFCPCGLDRSFAESLAKSESCPLATRLGIWLADQISKGGPKRRLVRGLIREVARLNARFEFNAAQSPRIGPAKARVTVVLFSDFECPYCRSVADPIKDLVLKHKDVALVYLPYPLSFHEHAEGAARTALAAHAQGKFWEMHDLLFENADDLDEALYDRLAEKLQLNLSRFRKDRLSETTNALLKNARKQGTMAGIEGTPTLYVNGLVLDDPEGLTDAIAEARAHALAP